MTSIAEIFLDFRKRLDADVTRNMGRGGIFLVQEFRNAIKAKTIVSSGSQGSLLSIQSAVKTEPNKVRMQLGLSSSGDYLKFRLFGVLPAAGALFPAHTHMPPVMKLLKWVNQSGLAVPKWAIEHAQFNADQYAKKRVPKKWKENESHPWYSTDAKLVWAFSIARKIKFAGREPLQHKSGGMLVETVLRLSHDKLTTILQGA